VRTRSRSLTPILLGAARRKALHGPTSFGTCVECDIHHIAVEGLIERIVRITDQSSDAKGVSAHRRLRHGASKAGRCYGKSEITFSAN
jgi:hypothetical protein